MLDNLKINKILFITLSNIGDVILALPVLDILRAKFPQAKLTIMVGTRPSLIFDNQPNVDIIIYNKSASLTEKIDLFKRLNRERFDLVVDLRNTAWGILLSSPYRTSPFLKIPPGIKHMKDRHMYRLNSLLGAGYSSRISGLAGLRGSLCEGSSLNISQKDKDYIDRILLDNGISGQDKIIVVSPGARSHIKRWKKFGFIALSNRIIERLNVRLILVGDDSDSELCDDIVQKMQNRVLNLCGKTSIKQLGCLLKKASLVITNDSAVLHLASYQDRSILAIFGPTDPEKYGPWSRNYSIIRRRLKCSPCQKPQCRFSHECMNLIQTQEVFSAAKQLLPT